MEKLDYRYKEKKPNLDYYSSDNKNLTKTFYNLPKDIEYCKKCLVNNQKPTMRSEHSFRSPHLWKKTNQGFKLRNSISDYFNKK